MANNSGVVFSLLFSILWQNYGKTNSMLFIADWCVDKMEKDDTSVKKHKRTTAVEKIKTRLQMIKALTKKRKEKSYHQDIS